MLPGTHLWLVAGLAIPCSPDPAVLPALQPVDDARQEAKLQIDPMLLAQAEAVWQLIGTPDNPLWPEWDASSTPVLIYLPGKQDVLLNHPRPPDGFHRYEGALAHLADEIVTRNGPTLIEWDGQNTSRDVNGVETLVIADTLSNRRQLVRGLLNDPTPTESKLSELDLDQLRTDPYKQISMIAHEAFHVYQTRQAPGKGANEATVRMYPCLSVENNVGVALEGEALAECLRAEDLEAARNAAVRWLAVRAHRRASLSAEAIAYEDGNEFMEGLAMYIEWVLFHEMEGIEADESLWWAQGFQGFDDLSAQREALIAKLLGNLRGEVNINNDPYGTSPVRGRLYFSGMGIAALLDRFSTDWKDHIFKAGITLTQLATEALGATEAELVAGLAAARATPGVAALEQSKRELAEKGRLDTERMVADIESGPGTLVCIDYSSISTDQIGLSFTAFGVRSVDTVRTIYTMVPISAFMGTRDYAFKQSLPLATLEDRGVHSYQFRLSEEVTAEELVRQLDGRTGVIEELDLELPGATLSASRATVEFQKGRLVVRYLPKT